MYTYRFRRIINFGWLVACLLSIQSFVYAALPVDVPNIKDTTVKATSLLDTNNDQFVYTYSVSSAPSNKGRIVSVSLDIKTDLNIHRTNPLPNHPEANSLVLNIVRKDGIRVVPVEQERKMGWGHISLTAKGFTTWAATKEYSINPGDASTDFKLTSPFPPGIRKMRFRPSKFDYGLYPNIEDSSEEKREYHAFVESLNIYVETLGPVGVILGSYNHWNQFRDDLTKSVELGWITDATLASIMAGQLASAREALDAGDGSLAKSRLQTLIDQVTNSTESQRNTEAHGLVLSNTQSLINHTGDTPIPYEPKLTLTPSVSKLPIGVQHTVTAKVVNVAHNNDPVPGIRLQFKVTEGPNNGLRKTISTDANGEAVFSYTGKDTGTDTIEVKEPIVES